VLILTDLRSNKMPLDPTIPLQGTPVNPIQNLQGIAQTAQGLLSLKQNQLQLGANQAISQAYSQSVNPDGSVDFGKLQALAAQSGAGAYLPQFMGQLATQRNQQLAAQSTQLDMALKQQQNLRGMIGSLALDPNLGKTDMTPQISAQIHQAVDSGVLPLQRGIQEMNNIPSDPKLQASWINTNLMNTISGEAKLQAMMPQNLAIQTGAGTQLINRNVLTGESTPGAFVQNSLSPQDLTAPKTIIGSRNEPRQVTTAQWLQMQAQNSGGMGGQGMGQPGQNPQLTGRYPVNPGQQQQMGGSPGVQSGLAPGENIVAEGGAKQLVADQNAASGFGNRMFQLNQALEGLQNTTTGKGSGNLQAIKSYLQTSGAGQYLGIDPNSVSEYDKANKYLTQYALSQANSFGEGTDSKLATTLSGNASTSISNLAAQDVVRANMGLERMKQAQVQAFNQSGLPPSQYQKFATSWNSNVDPRVFIIDSMSDQGREKLRQSMTPQQLQTFTQEYSQARANGWTPGRPQAATPAVPPGGQ
jgi:hypothetical protein